MEHGDRNGGPWIVEDIAKGPCIYAFQFRCLVLSRRLGLKRMPRVESETGKFTLSCGENFIWCKSVSQGLRNYQEDRCIVAEPIAFKSNRARGKVDEYHMFSVFDGHGRPSQGHRISDFCERNFGGYLKKELENLSALHPNSLDDGQQSQSSRHRARMSERSFRLDKLSSVNSITGQRRDVEEPFFLSGFERTCKSIDSAVRRSFPTLAMQNGSTATALMLGSNKVVFANLGDSRGAQFVVDNEGKTGRVVFATHDHKPSRFDEANRIAKAGGWVEANRVNGDLAVSRTIGDLEYKPHGSPNRLCPISIKPAVDVVQRCKGSGAQEMYILASDGLWDGITTADACQFVIDHVNKNARQKARKRRNFCQISALKAAVESLVTFVFKRRLSADNITVLVVMPFHPSNKPHDTAEPDVAKNASSGSSNPSTPQVEPEQSPSPGIPPGAPSKEELDRELKENASSENIAVEYSDRLESGSSKTGTPAPEVVSA